MAFVTLSLAPAPSISLCLAIGYERPCPGLPQTSGTTSLRRTGNDGKGGHECDRVIPAPSLQGRRRSSAQIAARSPTKKSNWSAEVMRNSGALDLEAGVSAKNDPREIARSLKRSAEASAQKSGPFRSATSMPSFYINRTGSSLSAKRRRILEKAKEELRREFGRLPNGSPRR